MFTRRLSISVVLALVAVAALAPSAVAKPAKATAQTFQGTVSKVALDHRAFRIRRAGHASVKIRLSRSTRHGAGRALKVGQKVRVRAHRGRRGWVATRIAPVKETAQDPSGIDDNVTGGDDNPTDEELAAEGDGSDPSDGSDTLDDLYSDSFPF